MKISQVVEEIAFSFFGLTIVNSHISHCKAPKQNLKLNQFMKKVAKGPLTDKGK
jgi:hypothetical protein